MSDRCIDAQTDTHTHTQIHKPIINWTISSKGVRKIVDKSNKQIKFQEKKNKLEIKIIERSWFSSATHTHANNTF